MGEEIAQRKPMKAQGEHVTVLPISTQIQVRLEQDGHFKWKIPCFSNLLRGSQPLSFEGLKRYWENDLWEERSGKDINHWIMVLSFKENADMFD